jgi:hypothetical protein
MEIKRALTVQNILDKKYDLFDFEDEWLDAFDRPEKTGVWFIWGNSGNGKTSFVLQLIKCLSKFENILFNSREEGTTHTLRKSFDNFGMKEVKQKLLVVNENMEKLTVRLKQKKSPKIVIIDSFQYTQMSYKDYLAFKEQFPNKLIIFISHADGKMPSGRSAKSVMYDASLKIWVEGYTAFSKGRYIGTTGLKGKYIIWAEKAQAYG